MTQDEPIVSVLVPTYNAEQFIFEALASVLRERETSIEVIVVNDQSTDHSMDVVSQFNDGRVRVVDGPGRGAASAMNTGLAAARGSIIMCCDSDDYYPGGRISQQARWLKLHPEYDAVCGKFTTVDRKGSIVAELQSGEQEAEITDELVNGKLRTSFCTYAVRSALVRKLGGFREFFKSSYDIDFQLRVGEAGRVAYLPTNCYFYRIHTSSITHTQSALAREFFERTAFAMQRQRQSSGSDDLQNGCSPTVPVFDQSQAHSAVDHIQGQLLGRAWREYRSGSKLMALRTGIRAMEANPTNIRVWKSVFSLFLKISNPRSSYVVKVKASQNESQGPGD